MQRPHFGSLVGAALSMLLLHPCLGRAQELNSAGHAPVPVRSLFVEQPRLEHLEPTPARQAPVEPASVRHLIAGGSLGALAGVALGALIGPSLIETGCERGQTCSGHKWVQNGAFGAIYLGTTLLVPYGVHRANGGRGRFLASLGATFLASGIPLTGLAATGEPLWLITVIPFQVGAAIWTERKTTSSVRPAQ